MLAEDPAHCALVQPGGRALHAAMPPALWLGWAGAELNLPLHCSGLPEASWLCSPPHAHSNTPGPTLRGVRTQAGMWHGVHLGSLLGGFPLPAVGQLFVAPSGPAQGRCVQQVHVGCRSLAVSSARQPVHGVRRSTASVPEPAGSAGASETPMRRRTCLERAAPADCGPIPCFPHPREHAASTARSFPAAAFPRRTGDGRLPTAPAALLSVDPKGSRGLSGARWAGPDKCHRPGRVPLAFPGLGQGWPP